VSDCSVTVVSKRAVPVTVRPCPAGTGIAAEADLPTPR